MIQAEVLADSKSPQGDRLITMKVTGPRYILAEFNTHRAFSRNSASSRAIPFKKMVKMIKTNPFIPIAWQKDHKGMQGTEYYDEGSQEEQICTTHWLNAMSQAVTYASQLNNNTFLSNEYSIIAVNATKQLCNRVMEAYMWHTIIVTSSEEGLSNFFELRCPKYVFGQSPEFKSRKDAIEYFADDPDYCHRVTVMSDVDLLRQNTGQADIHIMALAEAMWDARNESTPKQLQAGEWHIPFGDNMDNIEILCIVDNFNVAENQSELLQQAKCKIAVARCARISYQTLGDDGKIDYDADLKLYDRLSTSGHWSPFEHVAKAMSGDEYDSYYRGRLVESTVDNGCHPYHGSDGKEQGWCRNFRGFIQVRETMD